MAERPPQVRARLFLSYGRRDARELADRLRADLETRGYEVWQDVGRIRPGTEWERAIHDGLRGAQLLLAVLSPHAVRVAADAESPDGLDSACLDEIAYARFSQPPKPVVPVMAIPCEPPLFIFRLDYVDLGGWRESEERYRSGLRKLLEAVEAALRGEERCRSWVGDLRPWDFGAFLNEKRRHFCGRQWLFDEIDAWRRSSRERALLITGDPGAGKSAIVAELVHRNPDGQVLAYHCCQADTPATLQPGRFVRSLAAMIASRLAGYAAALSDPAVEQALGERSCAEDAASALEAGLLAPLASLAAPEQGARYVLVDALDEALALDKGSSRITIVDLLASRLERLPPWLRLVATTRKDRAVLDRLRGLRAQELDAQDPRNLDDLDRYIDLRLREPGQSALAGAGPPAVEAARRLLRARSAGNFLYVQQAFEGIERGLYRPDELEALPPGLYGLYLGFFQRQFPDEPSFAPVRSVLECVVAAQEALTRPQLGRATGLEEDDLARLLRALAVYLPAREGRYGAYHKSLVDWLTDPDQEGALHHVSRRRGHERLARLCWEDDRRDPRAMSEFALRHLATHLIGAGRWDDLAALLCDLSFVERKAAAGQVFGLVADYNAALGAWPGHEPYDPFSPRRAERAPGSHAPQGGAHVPDTPATLVESFSTFVSRHAHALHSTPKETVTLARNHAAEGAVVERASALAESLSRPWLARDPRPPAPPARPLVLRVLQGHADTVTSVAATPDARTVVSGGEDGTVRVWDAVSGACVRTLAGRSGAVNAVALSRDGAEAASGGEDRSVRVWDVAAGRCDLTLQGHGDRVTAVALSAEGRLAASGSWDGTVGLWDLASGGRARTLDHADKVTAVALTPDGRVVVSAGLDGAVRVWDVATGTCLLVLRGHSFWVSSVAVSRDGLRAASAGWDDTVRVWDLALGTCLRTLEGHVEAVTSVALSPDGRFVVSGSYDRTVRVWDAASGECRRVLRGVLGRGHAAAVTGVAASEDGGVVVSASEDRTLRLWDVASGTEARPVPGHGGPVRGLALTADGTTVLSAGPDTTLRLWSLAGGECLRALPGHGKHVFGLALAPDGKTAVSIGWDASGEARRTLRVFDVASGKVMTTLRGHEKAVWAAAVTPDARSAVSAGWDKTLRVWDLASGECLRTLRADDDTPLVTGRLRDAWRLRAAYRARPRGGHTEGVTSVTLSPDGRKAVSSSWDKSVCVWDLASGACLVSLAGRTGLREERRPSEETAGVALTPDGRIAVSADWDRTLRVWTVGSGREVHALDGPGSPVERVVIAPDGRTAVSAAHDKTLRVWDLASGRRVRTLAGHTAEVNAVGLTPDGRTVVSAGDDGTVRAWDLGSGECLAVHHAGAAVTAVTEVRPEGRLACGTADGQVQFLTLRGLRQDPPVVTAAVLWHLDASEPLKGMPAGRETASGHHDDGPTVACPWCLARMPLPASALEITAGNARDLDRADSPCLALPAEAWAEPRLEVHCPGCGRPLRLNPFVVDERDAS